MSETLITAFTTGLTSVQGDVVSLFTAALPIGIAIFGIGYAIRAGFGFFRSIAH